MANPLDPVLDHHTSQEGQPAVVPDYWMINLISHTIKVMLKILLNIPKPQAEKMMAEEQAGFRAEGAPYSRSSTYESFVRNISSTSKSSTMSS